MGWTVQYRATAFEQDIKDFVTDANKAGLKLSWGSEPYIWECSEGSKASGFSKIQYSWRPKTDLKRIVKELQRLAALWPGIRIDVSDDFVIGDWCHVKNIKADQMFKKSSF